MFIIMHMNAPFVIHNPGLIYICMKEKSFYFTLSHIKEWKDANYGFVYLYYITREN